ncbi:MAG: polyprenyl synthetase family protein [Lachnospiraceae bacterium]|nr:polyprenyl synthetase family protein [Lachnospiraceae bacterium]
MMQEEIFRQELTARTEKTENVIRKFLPPSEETDQATPQTILDAMNYSVLAGGKRLRPILMKEMYDMFGAKTQGIGYFMAAMEMIHTYSLVHDDLPAMDNDEYRRGKKTTWAVYGDAMGILAGDALLNYAVETAAAAFSLCREKDDYLAVSKALRILAFNAGINGMIGGQVADIEAEKQESELTEEQMIYIHTHKTGALIRAAMQIGAVMGGDPETVLLQQIERCAMDIGVAFQVQDDILDVIGDSAELGKPIGSDAANGKQTYVTLKGLEASKREVEKLSEDAIRILQEFPGNHDFMEALIRHLINRRS